ncbi:MAG: glutamate-1-semialdehyde 2,1-aminomutase [Acidobacteriota bacterium]
MSIQRSEALFERAQRVIPGGVNSPVRAFRAVGGIPRFIASAKGCFLTDADGNRYIDYVGSWGPMILGHARPEVVQAVQEAARRGTSFGAPTELEVLLAEKICAMVPSVEKVRLVNSGTEATMSALRVARGFTGRPMMIKFDGCYHGHSDSFLVEAGSGVATLGIPGTPGIPDEFAGKTLSLPYNDLDAVEGALERYPGQVAAIICEPVTGNMGVVVPKWQYLAELIALAEAHGALVIFDEVMTGFRLAPGGAQELFELRPHLTCLGKIVGGGLPLGAFGGRKDIMGMVAPEGPVYQAGTLSGNPLAVSAGLTTLDILQADPPYELLERNTRELCIGLEEAAAAAGATVRIPRCGSMFTIFFNDMEPVDFASVKRSDTRMFADFFAGILKRGVYLAPSQFEACFVSTAHTSDAIQSTIDAAAETFREVIEQRK